MFSTTLPPAPIPTLMEEPKMLSNPCFEPKGSLRLVLVVSASCVL